MITILGTNMCFDIVNNVAKEIFQDWGFLFLNILFSAETPIFCEVVPQIRFKIDLSQLSHKLYHMGGITPKYNDFLSFLTIFHSLNEFTSIYREIKKFELQVCYSLAPKLCKNNNNVVYNY